MIHIKPLFLVLAFILISPISAQAEDSSYLQELLARARESRLAEHPTWLKLGFYSKGLFGGYSTRAKGPFFLSPEGEQNPQAELEETLRSFFVTTERVYPSVVSGVKEPERQIPRCQFPARMTWLKKMLRIDESRLPPVECVSLNRFRARMGGKSASLVFSSFFLDSPSSTFGHSLIRVSRNEAGTEDSESLQLLDFGFGFAAEMVSNPVAYAVAGLAGLLKGTYTNIPYFYKVREYNDFESRDLWSYELNLDPEELSLLVDRIWEMGSVYHRYLYFTFNCANAILEAIEVAAPRYEITRNLKIYVIPSDTIKAVAQVPGLVRRVSYRPSAYSTFQVRLDSLDPKLRTPLEQMIENGFKVPEQAFTPEDRVELLDAAADYLDFKYAKDIVKEDSQAAEWRRELLAARAQIPRRSQNLKKQIPEHERPDLGHPSGRARISFGNEKNVERFIGLQSRFSMHDALDPPVGYPKHARVEMIGVDFRYLTDQRRLEVEELNFLRVFAARPVSQFSRNISWKASLGGERIRGKDCRRCFGAVASGGLGPAMNLGSQAMVYAFAEFDFPYAPAFQGFDFKPAGGPSLGWVWNTGRFSFGGSGVAFYRLLSDFPWDLRAETEVRVHFGNAVSLGVLGRAWREAWEGSAQASFFF